jgi:transposase
MWEMIKMPKTHQFSKEEYQEVMAQLNDTKSAVLRKKLEVLQLRMEGYKNAEIAKITKYSKSRVSALVCVYAKEGIVPFQQENRTGGHRRNMSYDEETTFLSTYKELAETGQIIEVSEIKKAYEEKVGHRSGKGQIYRVLARQGWRKVMPRSRHPKKASDEVIETSKKLKRESEN